MESLTATSSSDTYTYEDGHESRHSMEPSEAAVAEILRSIKNAKQGTAASYIPASDEQTYHTPLKSPPLHHKGVVRSKILYAIDDGLETCPIHGCAPCMSCESRDQPLLFPF